MSGGNSGATAQELPVATGRAARSVAAMRLGRNVTVPSCFGTPGPNSVVAGGDSNTATGGDSGVLGGISNQVCNNISSIVGGIDNAISDSTDSANRSFIGGGQDNVITGSGIWAFIGSGLENTLTGQYGMLGGGENNRISGDFATLGGGDANIINTGGTYGFVGGGFNDRVGGQYGSVAGGQSNQANGLYSAVPGGQLNVAAGEGSFAAGMGSSAPYAGDFVWSDLASGATAIAPTAANQFLARARGGVTFYSSANLAAGVHLAPGSGTWSSLSDRNVKTGISPISDDGILAKVTALPITEWSYTTEPGVRHVGPMAQDFYAAFNVGEDDRHITSIDEDGVALAAIKALHRENEALKSELRSDRARQDAALADLRREMRQLEAKVSANH
ncbi:MAG: tail fiber domain-containing protein [Vulcanimicrobiaceae bacterium]